VQAVTSLEVAGMSSDDRVGDFDDPVHGTARPQTEGVLDALRGGGYHSERVRRTFQPERETNIELAIEDWLGVCEETDNTVLVRIAGTQGQGYYVSYDGGNQTVYVHSKTGDSVHEAGATYVASLLTWDDYDPHPVLAEKVDMIEEARLP
jgi:hypothetical protein